MQLCVSAAPPALLVSCVAFFLSFLGAAAGRITCRARRLDLELCVPGDLHGLRRSTFGTIGLTSLHFIIRHYDRGTLNKVQRLQGEIRILTR